MYQRLWLYIKTMYPPLPSFGIAFFSFFNLYLVLQLLPQSVSHLVVTSRSLAGSLTVFLFLLFLRISDEFKDEETDKRLFPERPLPSGQVLHNDLVVLMRATVGGMLLLNLWMGWALLPFALLLGYGWLMLHYFFVPQIISKRLILALVTHNPSVLFLNVYVMGIFAQDFAAYEVVKTEGWRLLILFWLPGLAWELARKIKTPADENAYETYSRIFGYRLATALPLMVVLSHYFLLHRTAVEIGATALFLTVLKGIALLTVMVYLIFMAQPTSFLASRLKPVTEAYMLVTTVAFFLQLTWGHSMTWRWI